MTYGHTLSACAANIGSAKTGETCRVQEVKTGFPQKYVFRLVDVRIFDRLRYGSPVVRDFSRIHGIR